MSPEEKVKWLILKEACAAIKQESLAYPCNASALKTTWDAFQTNQANALHSAMKKVHGAEDTGADADRLYASAIYSQGVRVATQLPDGTHVTWVRMQDGHFSLPPVDSDWIAEANTVVYQRYTLSPKEKVKWLICDAVCKYKEQERLPYPCDVNALWSTLQEQCEDDLLNAKEDLRGGGECTGLDSPSSRYYEGTEVAAQLPDGSWVGWTFWHGGGKHGAPWEIEWMSEAYPVACRQETRIVNIFSKE